MYNVDVCTSRPRTCQTAAASRGVSQIWPAVSHIASGATSCSWQHRRVMGAQLRVRHVVVQVAHHVRRFLQRGVVLFLGTPKVGTPTAVRHELLCVDGATECYRLQHWQLRARGMSYVAHNRFSNNSCFDTLMVRLADTEVLTLADEVCPWHSNLRLRHLCKPNAGPAPLPCAHEHQSECGPQCNNS